MTDQDPQEQNTVEPPSDSQTSAGFTILDVLILLARHTKLIFGLPSLAAVIAVLVSIILPNWYAGTAKILPPRQSQSNAVAILGQLGAVSGGAGQILGARSASDVYVAMLRSRRVADSLIQKFDLGKVYGKELMVDTRRLLAQNSNISAGREGIITIEVEDKDPKRAADIANGYVESLRGLTLNLAVTEAGQRRLFFENQLKNSKNDLVRAEIDLKQYSEQTGLINPPGQVSLTVNAAGSLRANI